MSEWQRNLYLLVIIQLLATSTFQIVTPFLPFFVAELGVTDPRSLKAWSGILLGVNALFSGLMSPFWGALADRYGHKPMLVRSAASVAIFTVLPAFVTSAYQLLICRILMGVFSGFSSAALTLAASTTPENRLGFALGWLQTGQVLGLVLGPLIGGVLADIFPFRVVFMLAGLLAITGTILAATLVHEDFHPPVRAAAKNTEKSSLIGLLSWPLTIYSLFVVIFLSQFATRGVEPLMPLYVRELSAGSSNFNTLVGLVVAVTGLAQVIAVTILGRQAPYWGYKRCLLACLAGSALFYFPQALVGQVFPLISLRFFQGLFLGGLLPMANSLIGLFTPPEKRGRVYGLTQSAFFLGNFSGPLAGGFWAALFGLRSVFYAASILLFLNFIWVWREVREPQTALKISSGK
ncbi:Tetracycline resistance protein, TetA/multidrug resistance protein MdtG [Moorella glycerini]|uniref:Tetracycline resistance protein, class B n=1 Tax=Neomoorella stamsii TaxID=1266720 RepID=A0A9X7J4A5_9FIRM|nr:MULTISPECIES: MFS transporter [Moorella]PRR74364.1 Tetracycline resistance protein, class B [Moorella stamsii]CEP66771.1 Tetracycline resistance protein, TetA/multidrug resistance protein MdtG [Moorella glycerini]